MNIKNIITKMAISYGIILLFSSNVVFGAAEGQKKYPLPSDKYERAKKLRTKYNTSEKALFELVMQNKDNIYDEEIEALLQGGIPIDLYKTWKIKIKKKSGETIGVQKDIFGIARKQPVAIALLEDRVRADYYSQEEACHKLSAPDIPFQVCCEQMKHFYPEHFLASYWKTRPVCNIPEFVYQSSILECIDMWRQEAVQVLQKNIVKNAESISPLDSIKIILSYLNFAPPQKPGATDYMATSLLIQQKQGVF